MGRNGNEECRCIKSGYLVSADCHFRYAVGRRIGLP